MKYAKSEPDVSLHIKLVKEIGLEVNIRVVRGDGEVDYYEVRVKK